MNAFTRFFTLETNRPTDVQWIGKTVMQAGFVVLAVYILIAPLMVQIDYTRLDPGDDVQIAWGYESKPGEGGAKLVGWEGDKAIVVFEDGRQEKVSAGAIIER